MENQSFGYRVGKWFSLLCYWSIHLLPCLEVVIIPLSSVLRLILTFLKGNPKHERFGFEYWNNPGPFAEFIQIGSKGRFMGFVYCLVQAAFAIAGPEYGTTSIQVLSPPPPLPLKKTRANNPHQTVSMTAGEAENPRVVLPKAYKSIFYRLTFFFVLGALATGINVPYNDEILAAVYDSDRRGAAASPFVRAMNRLGITVLPDIVNVLILTSAFSAGNSTLYCATRSLYGLALEGKAPRVLTRCTKAGVPYLCVFIVFCISMLAFLSVNNSAAVVLNWFISLVTASQLINFCVITFTFTRWKKACEAQGLVRDELPYTAPFQPWASWVTFGCCFFLMLINGWQVFLADSVSRKPFLEQSYIDRYFENQWYADTW